METCASCRLQLETVGPVAAETAIGATRTFDGTTTPGDAVIALDDLRATNRRGSLERFGPYKVLEQIGQGGMGVVLKALDERLNRIVAVKVLAPGVAGDGLAKQRFIREARAAAAVSHDHVVTIHAVDEVDGQPYIVMQLVPGQSLQEKLDRSGPLPVTEVLRIGTQIASGLAAAHAKGLVHRDIKPANILLETGTERIKITDFGLARAVDDTSLTASGTLAGTPSFMSPEQARGDPVDSTTDLFSLGSVLYAMCTGQPPFRAESTVAVLRRVSDEPPRPIRELNPDVPDWLVAIIEKLMAKDPAERLQSATEVAEVLSAQPAEREPRSQPSSSVAANSGAAAKTKRTIGVTAAILALAAATIGFLSWLGFHSWDKPRSSSEQLTRAPEVPAPPSPPQQRRPTLPGQRQLRGSHHVQDFLRPGPSSSQEPPVPSITRALYRSN